MTLAALDSNPVASNSLAQNGPAGEPAGLALDIHCGWGATHTAPDWGDAAHVRTALRARGIGQAFLASDLARRYDLIQGNEQIAEALAGQDDLRAWLVIHPARAAEAHAQMRRYLYESRFVGCALYPDPLTGAPITLRDARDLINAFRRFAKPLLVAAESGAAMREVSRIADEMSGMKVIAAGMGGTDWREAVDLTANHLNLYLEISGALSADKLDYAIATLHGVRKLLFGSGAPHTDPAAVMGLLDDLDLSPDDRERILSGNAARVFDLDTDLEAGAADLRPMAAADDDENAAPGLAPLSPET